jgi:predicted membrane-bound mannosyltransferase
MAALALIVMALVSVTLFSSFFTHARGPLDSLLTYGNYAGKSEHSLHEYGAGFYLTRLAGWNEKGGPWFQEIATLAFALAGVILHFTRPGLPGTAGARALAFHALVVAAAYFSFDYKTPWLLLNLLLPLHLLAGWGVASLWRILPSPLARGAIALTLGLAAWDLNRQIRFSTLRFPSGPRNPFAYVHTGKDLVRLSGQIHDVVAQAPHPSEVAVHVMAAEYWPLPWYLRDLPNVGYWYELNPDSRAPILVVSSEFNDRMNWTVDTHQASMAGLRPGVSLTAYYRQDLWDKYVQSKQTPTTPEQPAR